ncbi:hypothetical protein [Streptomyces sp. NPDC055109]
MPDDDLQPAPRTAAEAAHLLAREGHHVHLVSEDIVCLAGRCRLDVTTR